MNARAATCALLLAPFAAAPGCLLPSYERVPAEEVPSGGKGGNPNTGGSSTGGTEMGGQGGAGGESGAAPGGEGGTGGKNPVTIPVYKQYVVEQGTNLSVSASRGLFVYSGDEDRSWTNVASTTRDTTLPAGAATLDVDPRTGAFTFEPSPELFGVYHAKYVLENDLESGEHDTGQGDLYITVQPVAVDIDAVLDRIGGFVVSGSSGEGVGRAVAGAGDIDGDGFGDFLVGAPGAAGGAGRVYLVFGARDRENFTLTGSPPADARYTVISGSEKLGTSVSGAGDLDGDGLADFIVGAPGEIGSDDGHAYVVYGRSREALSGSIDDVVAAGGFGITRATAREAIGALVAGGADLTGDDTPDLVVFGQSSGSFYVVDGSSSSDIELATDAEPPFGNGTSDSAAFRALGLLGDTDGDDAGDLVVGTGSVAAVMKGPASGFPSSLASPPFTSPDDGLLIDCSGTGLGFVAASAAADFDADGVFDSAFCHANNDASERCRVFFGMPSAAGDGSAVTGFGSAEVRVAGGGETSGDAYADLLFAETDSVTPVSSAFVVFGRATRAATLDIGSLGDRGFSITGASDIQSVALGGDIDGPSRDGVSTADWLIGDAAGNGRVTVIFGGKFSR